MINKKQESPLGVCLFLIGSCALLAASRTVHYLLFHTLAEIFAITVSFSIFALTWTSRTYLKNSYLTILGAAYGTIGVIDVFHTLTFKGMNLFPAVTTNHPTQFWLTARTIEAIALVSAALFIGRPIRFSAASWAFAVLGTTGCLAVWYDILPATFVDGVGLTPFKVGSEYAIVGILTIGLALLWRARQDFSLDVFRLVSGSLLLAIATEICFIHYISFYDYINELGHYFRLFSVVLAFLAIVVTGVRRPAELLFRQVIEKDRELTAINDRLAKSEDRLKHAQAVAGVGSWHFDITSDNVSCSDEAHRIFGFPFGTPLTFESFVNCVHPEDRENVLAAWNAALHGAAYDIEHRVVIAEQIKWVRERAEIQFAPDGQALVGVGSVQDVTERKRAELAVLSASVAKSVFLSTMSHEIRTPINVIIGLSYLLRRDLTNPEHQGRLDQIKDTSDHLLEIVNNVLDFSKIEASRLLLDQRKFNLGAMVDRVLRIVRGLAEEKGLSLKASVDQGAMDLWLTADPLRLAQVLINLCGNAVKFTDHGFVHLSIRPIDEKGEKLTLRFIVEDTGIGIAEQEQALLFQPFIQADNSLTRERGGTGLGLTISQSLVHLMGGTIRIESTPGKGSRFSFELDLPRATAGVDERTPEVPAKEICGSRVLFAEDHPLSQEILFEMLNDLGCEVDAAADGVEAVERAKAGRYDLILLDMQMPRMDGLAAARAIRALPGHGRTPILALTANVFSEDRQRCLDAGMSSFISKPISPAMLAAVLSQWLPGLKAPSDESPVFENELSHALCKLPGCDEQSFRSQDEMDDYCRLLLHFVQLHAHDMARFRAHLLTGERDAALGVVHQLVGIAGLIGAQRISSLATQIHQGLRTAQDLSTIMDLASRCETELASLSEATETLLVLPIESAAAH